MPIVFLDRDGVVNELVPSPQTGRHESPHRPADVALTSGAASAIQRLHRAGYIVVVVSNQPGAAKGETSLECLVATHERVRSLLELEGAPIDEYLYCFHHPQGTDPSLTSDCDCRKPKPGLLVERLSREGRGERERSWMVGDADSDVAAGIAAGVRTVLVENPLSEHRRRQAVEPTIRLASLPAAADAIIGWR